MSRAATVSTLCTQCGLCCNGVLFDQVRLRPDEEETLASAQLPLRVIADSAGAPARKVLQQACVCHSANGCTMYESRPAACRSYVCLLAQALLEDETSLPEAQALVAQTQALIQQASANLPTDDGSGASLLARVARAQATQQGDQRLWSELVQHLHRVFLGRAGR